MGEPPIVPTAGAIANAVADAIGVRLSDMPMTAPRVLAALRGYCSREACQRVDKHKEVEFASGGR